MYTRTCSQKTWEHKIDLKAFKEKITYKGNETGNSFLPQYTVETKLRYKVRYL